MNPQTTLPKSGCTSAACACQVGGHDSAQPPVASVNGMALHAPGQRLEPWRLREAACSELLRQEAVQAGLLPPVDGSIAPALTPSEQQVIEAMVEQAVVTPQPTEKECRRYYDAHRSHFVFGQTLHVRHILFAVTPGVNVHALTLEAEKALLQLARNDVPPERFAQLAAELSNCPTGAQGGDLGWVGPEDCAPELANELFHQKDAGWGMGVHPRLVHTRYGFHIIEVLGRRRGRQAPFGEVHERIAAELAARSRAVALRQYMSLLAGQAQLEGVALEGADTPLVQ